MYLYGKEILIEQPKQRKSESTKDIEEVLQVGLNAESLTKASAKNFVFLSIKK